MASSSDLDVEAQCDVLKPHQVGEEENHGTTNHPSEVVSDVSRAPADQAQPVASTSQAKGREGVVHKEEKGIHRYERQDTRQASTQAAGEVHPGASAQTQRAEDHNKGGPVLDDSVQEPHMIGDFHGSVNTLWSLYGKEAKSYDEARIQPLKKDMDGVLIFAGLFSAALTPFVVDSKQSLQVNPADQMVYYLQQHSTILSQISQQIASIAPEVSIPSTPPPPFPPFNQSASDIRINAFWFMALAFSLSAALLAILIQQWVRNYMHVFQRYSDAQKSARLRQYLYEGSEGWYLPIVAEAVPGLLHVSLFLFFVGLADYTLDINATIGLSTTVPIGICGLLYIFTTLAPVIYPQSPYQTSFSGVIWYVIQKLRGRKYQDRDGESKIVSTNMAQGQMQLSMEKTKERNGRDKRAVLWLLENLTEDAEIESFVMSMPGSLEVWTELSKSDVIHNRSITTTSTHERNTIRVSCWRIGHFFDTCKNRADFASEEEWRMRASACVEVMASLVFNADAEVGWFGDTLRTLGDIGSLERMHDLSLAGTDEAFVVRWTCLSILAIRPALKSNLLTKQISVPVGRFWVSLYTDQVGEVRQIDKTLETRWRTGREWRLSSKLSFAADIVEKFNDIINFNVVEMVDEVSQRITRQLPGVDFDFPNSRHFLRQTLELFGDPAKLRFISCRLPLSKFFDYLRLVDGYQDNTPNLEYEQVIEKIFWPKNLLQRMLWSLDDLYDGGLGFTVELFLLSLRQLLSTYPSESQDSYSTLYTSTFRAITSVRGRYKNSLGTIKLLFDVVVSEQGFLRTFEYPDYIVDEVWELLGDILEVQTSFFKKRHIDRMVQQLTDLQHEEDGKYEAKAKAVISQLRNLSTSSS